jgi:endonuclease/exonuclease/phosphatase (EEP) superfamily protein YafD
MFVLLLPWIAVIDIIILVYLIIKRCNALYITISVISIIAINLYGHLFAIPIQQKVYRLADNHQLSVLSWNIDGSEYDSAKIANIIGVIRKYNPDLVFLAEDFYTCCDSIDKRLNTDYPYSTHSVCNESHYFYSKYPLASHQWITRDIDSLAVIVKSCVLINGTTIDLYGCHLSSNNYGETINLRPNDITNIESFSNYVTNINHAAELRYKESLVTKDSVASNNNSLIMGDFNDIFGSRALNLLRSSDLSDAWWYGGFGYGATIHNPAPYRIDYIFYNREYLELNRIVKIDSNGLSDHDALYAEFSILHVQ